MSEKKRKLLRLIEHYINDIKGDAIQEMYGKGTKVQIKTFDYITQGKYVMVEAVIVLGEIISEEVMDREMVDLLIQDALLYIVPGSSTKVMIRWDV